MIEMLNKDYIRLSHSVIFSSPVNLARPVPIRSSGLDSWLLPGCPGSTPGMGRDASGTARTHQIIDYFGI